MILVAHFNSRLQPTQIALGTIQNGTDKLKFNYDYGTTQNNGNVLSQQITVPTVGANQGFTAVQTYSYDSLNRLESAVENIGTIQTWKQTFIFDRYGNRNFDIANTTTLGSCPANQCNPTIDTANNRFTTGQDYTFDLAGNLITDATGKSFVYDAENKQTSVTNTSGTIGTYLYDGDGKRVKKISAMETVIFVYNAGGQLVAEYSTQISQTPQVSYLTNDTLGTPRINTDANGNVIARHDYLPFSEEVFTAQRTNGLNYTADNVRQKFTGYQRDEETGLDFAEARYYNKEHGRFNSPDPIMMEGSRITDPQAINLYVYVRNNPLEYTDPDGKSYVGTNGKKVKVKYLKDKDGNIIGIKSLGKNATPELRKIVSLIEKFKSKEGLSDFIRGDKTTTRVKLAIKVDLPFAMSELKGADGVPEYIKDPKTGEMILKEITLELNEDVGRNPDFVKFLENSFGVSNITSDEYLLAGFGHELEHGLGEEFNVDRRKVYLDKNTDEETRKDRLYNFYLKSEVKAKDRARKVLEEIKKYQKGIDSHPNQWR